MSSNFNFLTGEWAQFGATATAAERNSFSDPMYCAILCRKSAEEFVRWIYDNDDSLQLPYDTTLNALIHERTFISLVGEARFRNLKLIKKLGNDAVHTNKKITVNESFHALKLLHEYAAWVVQIYSRVSSVIPAFDEKFIPTEKEKLKSKAELEQFEIKYEQALPKLVRKDDEIIGDEIKFASLKEHWKEIQAIKATPKQISVPHNVSEAETRKIYIDILLKEAGWDPDGENVAEYEVQGMPNTQEVGYVDYVLWGDDGLPLAVVEAKRTLIDAKVGQHQAFLYAECLQSKFGQRPVIFYTNGFETWLWDDLNYPERKVQGFYTRQELQLLINRRTERKKLSAANINRDIVERYYQTEAIKRVAETFESHGRKALLVMATGSGKTRTAAALVDILSKANWAKRILFLADRRALVRQAKNAFTTHLPQLTSINLLEEKEDEDSRLVFSTYPTIMNRIDGERTGDNRFYGPGHFDLIIVDEAHRSIYVKYKAIFEYFDALLVGLTATPKSEADRDTYNLFDLEPHNPTYAYELDQAVTDQFLRPPKAMSVPLKFQREGIKYLELSEEEKKEYEETFADDDTGLMPDEIGSSALNEWLFNTDTVDKVLVHLMDNGQKVEGGDKLGKSIIFAKNHTHAVFIEQRFNFLYPKYRGHFLQIIDNYAKYAHDLLDRFTEPDKLPQIAVSVDMLDTGIDIPEILNLVFFKPVKSSAKFWQMIGRGTRLCPNIFGPGQDKKFFYIFDYCQNFEFFDQHPEGIEPNQYGTLSQHIFNARVDIAFELASNYAATETVNLTTLLDSLHGQIIELDRESFIVRRVFKTVDQYRERECWNHLTRIDLIEIKGQLSGLMSDDKSDELARRFDLLILTLELASLKKSRQADTIRQRVVRIAKQLEKKTSIPAVAAQLELIRVVQTDAYWVNVSLSALEQLRLALRDLIQFLDKTNQPIVYTSFEDEIGGEVREFDLIKSSTNLESYKYRVEKYIRDHQNNLTISKLRMNVPITAAELDALEKMLLEENQIKSAEDFQKVIDNKPLGHFIREIIGLDVNAAKQAFGEFLNEKTYTAQQIHFINKIIDYLGVNGVIESKILFEPPFTDINDQGLSGIFSSGKSAEVISILSQINTNALIA